MADLERTGRLPVIDWQKHPAIVLESDDWGYCGWVPDQTACEELKQLPSHRSSLEDPMVEPYFGSTLESAPDMQRLGQCLREFRGGDGYPALMQANYILGAPDFVVMKAEGCQQFEAQGFPAYKDRWRRPGLGDTVLKMIDEGLWAAEYHGWLHFNLDQWLEDLRQGEERTNWGFEREMTVTGLERQDFEYDPSLDRKRIASLLHAGILQFEEFFGRKPKSTAAPDFGWNDEIETLWRQEGIQVVQGWRSQKKRFRRLTILDKLSRRITRPPVYRKERSHLVYLSQSAALEPMYARAGDQRYSPSTCIKRIESTWGSNRPAVIATHRFNYVHLDQERVQDSCDMLKDFLKEIHRMNPNTIFLTDWELAQLHYRGWSVRHAGIGKLRARNYLDRSCWIRIDFEEQQEPSLKVFQLPQRQQIQPEIRKPMGDEEDLWIEVELPPGNYTLEYQD